MNAKVQFNYTTNCFGSVNNWWVYYWYQTIDLYCGMQLLWLFFVTTFVLLHSLHHGHAYCSFHLTHGCRRYNFHIVRIFFFVYVNLFRGYLNEIINLPKLVPSKANYLNSIPSVTFHPSHSVRHAQISVPGHEIHAKFGHRSVIRPQTENNKFCWKRLTHFLV